MVERLQAISEELADAALAELRRALGDRDEAGERPSEAGVARERERRITRARRAVEKAIVTLASIEDLDADPGAAAGAEGASERSEHPGGSFGPLGGP